MTVTGIDVSHHQGAIDWQRVARGGAAFAVVKATEGVGFFDSHFVRNVEGARAAGLIVGAYHFARPGSLGATDAIEEARHFVATIKAVPVDFTVLDIEDDRVASGRRLDTWLRAWLASVEAATLAVPWIYSYASYWREHGSPDPYWRRFPWWLADYTAPAGSVAPWGAPTVWQFTSSGAVPGVSGRCDVNRFEGSLDDFRRLAGIDQEDDDMTDGDRTMLREVHDMLTAITPQIVGSYDDGARLARATRASVNTAKQLDVDLTKPS